MKRADRRARTEKVAKRRFKEFKQLFDLSNEFGTILEIPDSDGFFRKKSGLSNKKDSSRKWEKIYKQKVQKIRDDRRNSNVDDLDD